MNIKISWLKKDGLQTRVALDEGTVADYAASMREGRKFPPVKVFFSADNYFLADGFHRVEAAVRAGFEIIDADVTNGTFVDALRYALGCNSKHGKRVTNEDKQNAMRIAWENRRELFGGDPAAPLLAEACGVHESTARRYLTENHPAQILEVADGDDNQPTTIQPLANGTPAPWPKMPVRRVVGRDGKTRTMPVRPTSSTPSKWYTSPAPAHVVPLDRYGTEIPPKLQPAFDGVEQLHAVRSVVSKARCALRDGGAPFGAVRQDALVMLNNAYNFIAAADPHCVCRMCQGQGCDACHGRGWQTGEEYDRNPPDFKAEEVPS